MKPILASELDDIFDDDDIIEIENEEYNQTELEYNIITIDEAIEEIIDNFEEITGYSINSLYRFVDPTRFDNDQEYQDYITEYGEWDWTNDLDNAFEKVEEYLKEMRFNKEQIQTIENLITENIINDYVLEDQYYQLSWN